MDQGLISEETFRLGAGSSWCAAACSLLFIVMAVSFTGSGLRVMDTDSFNPLPTLQMTY